MVLYRGKTKSIPTRFPIISDIYIWSLFDANFATNVGNEIPLTFKFCIIIIIHLDVGTLSLVWPLLLASPIFSVTLFWSELSQPYLDKENQL